MTSQDLHIAKKCKYYSKIGYFTTTNLTVTTVTVSMYLLTWWLLLQFLSISNINSHNSKNTTYLFLIRSLQHCLYIRIISHVEMSVKQYKVFNPFYPEYDSSRSYPFYPEYDSSRSLHLARLPRTLTFWNPIDCLNRMTSVYRDH